MDWLSRPLAFQKGAYYMVVISVVLGMDSRAFPAVRTQPLSHTLPTKFLTLRNLANLYGGFNNKSKHYKA